MDEQLTTPATGKPARYFEEQFATKRQPTDNSIPLWSPTYKIWDWLTPEEIVDILPLDEGDAKEARQSAGTVTLATTYQDLTGATITVTNAGKYLVVGIARFSASSTGWGTARVKLVADGVDQTGLVAWIDPGESGGGTYSQAWVVDLEAGDVIKLMGQKTINGGTVQTTANDTKIVCITIAGAASGGGGGGVTDHGALTGLSDDDHPQYRLESADHTHQSTGAEGGQLDHGLALTGLTDDDHTIYLKEKVSGGTAAEVPEHDHSEADEAGTVSHGDLTSVTSDQHHDKSHGHTGADASGTVDHDDLTNVTSDQHHAQLHDIDTHDTSATGAQLDTLTDGSDANALHTHPNTLCHVYHNANQAIGTGLGVRTALAFNSEAIDPNGMHDTSTNNGRITFPSAMTAQAGVSLNLGPMGGGAATMVIAYIKLTRAAGGTADIAVEARPIVNNAFVGTILSFISPPVSFAAGDYITVEVSHDYGANRNVVSTAEYSPRFYAVEVD